MENETIGAHLYESDLFNTFNKLAGIVVDHGFTVTPTRGKAPVVRHWQNPKPTDLQWLGRMLKANRFANRNLGIVCGRCVALDLDADELAKAELIESLAFEHVGQTPFRRVGRAPRTLLLYRPADGENIPSMTIAGCIDVLSGGKQFVAFGIHPDTGKPYQWMGLSPATAELEDLPVITAASLQSFAAAVPKALGRSHTPISARTVDAALKSRQRARQPDMLGAYDNRIVRNADGRVVDGREAFMAKLISAEFAMDKGTSPDTLANRVWARFIAEADLSRPKGSNSRQRWQLKDALVKARSICRRKPELKRPRRSRGGHPASYLHAWRKPGFWTQAKRERLHAEVGQSISTPVVLAVSRVMIEGVDLVSGFCTLSIAEIAKRASCSAKSVTKARTALSKTGLWIAGPGGVFVPTALNSNQVPEGRADVGLGRAGAHGNANAGACQDDLAIHHDLPLLHEFVEQGCRDQRNPL